MRFIRVKGNACGGGTTTTAAAAAVVVTALSSLRPTSLLFIPSETRATPSQEEDGFNIIFKTR